MIVPFAPKRTASGELPVTTPEVRQRLTNSLIGADDAEVQRQAVVANPSRLLVRQVCNDCGHQWQAPTQGACPTCHSPQTVVLENIICMALRV